MKNKRDLLIGSLNAILTLAGIFSTSTTRADWPRHHGWCANYEEATATIIAQNIDQILGGCRRTPLRRGFVIWQSQSVPGWNGGYVRTVRMTTTYRIDHYDHCSGSWLWSDEKLGTQQTSLPFVVYNPNADDDVQASYIANAPMTKEEAQAALPEALRACQSIKVGPWF